MKRIPGPGFSFTLRVSWPDAVDGLGLLAAAAANAGATIDQVVRPEAGEARQRAVTFFCGSLEHQQTTLAALRAVEGVAIERVDDDTYFGHRGGKLRVAGAEPLLDARDLSRQYTPGVARICRSIANDVQRSFVLTQRQNMVAVISDGSAILGLGNLGPEAALPVMEGKALLFKTFGGVDAFPIVLATQDVDAIVETAALVAPSFGGINLEDISAPRCFEIEKKLQERVEIPVFHDDQHGTAVVTLAGLVNAAKVVGKRLEDLTVVFQGVGAAGTACAKLFLSAGIRNIVGVNRSGILFDGKPGLNPAQRHFAAVTNPGKIQGGLADAMRGADVFVGLSGPDTVTVEHIRTMARDPIVFAMSNPDPEINPEAAGPHVRVMATGRSDYPNQINNVIAFPGIFRGALDAGAKRITHEMNIAASRAIAAIAEADGLSPDHVIPHPFDRRVPEAVAKAVHAAAIGGGDVRKRLDTPGVGSLADV
ncbi:MAG: NADP-dependent malic enzyme [Planctomycetota bacterium]|jgi:malate dehydrogenase (oxaloacetate-decarboxylating)|nr:NADP-dependent malic enzyme [Planctomycetota bacterium]